MATPPPFASQSPSSIDRTSLSRARALQSSQLASVLLPSSYVLTHALYLRRPLSLSHFLRFTWIGTLGAAGAGAVTEWGLLGGRGEREVAARAWAVQHDVNQVRASDYSIIGAFLGSLVTSAALWKRAPRIHVVLGGAALGEGAGWAVHLYQRYVPTGVGAGGEAVKIVEEKASTAQAVDNLQGAPGHAGEVGTPTDELIKRQG